MYTFLIENKQFLLLIDIPIQDRACQITIHQVFTLDIPHGNFSAHYDINTRYFGITKDATMGLELSTTQFQTCQQANGQFCHISAPFQSLAITPTCIAALYAKSKASITSKCSLQLHKTTTTTLPTQITSYVWILTTPAMAPVTTITLICPEKPMETTAIWQSLHILKLPMACSATSAHFYLPPGYETPVLNVNKSLDMANLQAVNITAPHFHIWQHMGSNHSETQLPTPCNHTINTSTQSLSTPPKQLLTTDTFQYEAIRRYKYSMELVHPPRNICFSFGITYTSRNRIILLLFLLVPTCQISMLTFTIR